MAVTPEGIRCESAKNRAGQPAQEYLIEWSSLIEQLFREIKTIPRRVGSVFLFPNNEGQPYSDSGFKCLWNRLMHDYQKGGGTWFHAHDLRAMYCVGCIGKINALMQPAPTSGVAQKPEKNLQNLRTKRGAMLCRAPL